MTGVSGPDLVIASCLANVIGSFPTNNCKSTEEVDAWLTQIQNARNEARANGKPAGALAMNIVIRGNKRLAEDIDVIAKHKPDFVITSVGSPIEYIAPLHDRGIAVIANVVSMRHVEKALEAGCDGLVLVSGGAGGQTGWANGMAYGRTVRSMFSGPLFLAGGIIDGAALWSAITLGYDFAHMGTRFIATHESMASKEYRDTLIEVSMDDVETVVAANGVNAASIKGNRGSAGHTVNAVTEILATQELVNRTKAEWDAARARTRTLLG